MRAAWGPAVVLAMAAVLAPSWVNGVALVHIRLPFLPATVVVAGSVCEGLNRRQLRLVAALVIALIAARGLAFERLAARHSAEITQMVSLFDALPPAARLLPLRAPGRALDRRLWHAQAYAVTYRDTFVPTLFQGVHAIELLPRWRAYASPAPFAPDIASLLVGDPGVPFYGDWQHKFDYALLLDDDRAMVDAQHELREIARSGRFTLYRITPHRETMALLVGPRRRK